MRSSRLCFYTTIALIGCSTIVPAAATYADAVDPAALFLKKCSSCHSYGQGDRIGPDLKGVTIRRTRTWLIAWIRSSQRMVESGDPIARALFEKFRHERMPDQNFSPDEIGAIVDYLAAGGPASGGSRPRHAMTATPTEVALGRDLFVGAVTPQNGGAPCRSCHSVRHHGDVTPGATLGEDLTHVYSRFQDAALSTFLQHPCFPRAFKVEGVQPLTNAEAFAVKAFLWRVDRDATARRREW